MSLTSMWTLHGTKLLGGLTVALAAVASATPAQFSVWGIDGPTALRITVAASGLLTIVRGFTNSATIAADQAAPPAPPPPEPPPETKP